MKKLLSATMMFAALLVMTACGNKSASQGDAASGDNAQAESISPEEMSEQGYSLKYEANNETLIYTRKGVSTRVDQIREDGRHAVMIETKGDDGYTGYGYDPYDKDWTMDEYQARQGANNSFSMIKDMSSVFTKRGYEENGTIEILGRTCTVYEGTYVKQGALIALYPELSEDGKHGKFATWNGYALLIKCDQLEYDDATDSNKVVGERTVLECKAIQIGVPDEAFGKTVDVTWIK